MRAPVGFVVEGTGEYYAFHHLVRKGVVAPHGKLPVAHGGGNGGVVKYLEEKLVEVVKAAQPVGIIVCLDLKEALAEGRFESCKALRLALQERCDRWLDEVRARGALSPAPHWIRVVIQVPKFEGWLTADRDGLAALIGCEPSDVHEFENVDESMSGHVHFLDSKLPGGFRKKPAEAVDLCKSLHPVRIARYSRSFDKFWRTVLQAYVEWKNETGIDFSITGAT